MIEINEKCWIYLYAAYFVALGVVVILFYYNGWQFQVWRSPTWTADVNDAIMGFICLAFGLAVPLLDRKMRKKK